MIIDKLSKITDTDVLCKAERIFDLFSSYCNARRYYINSGRHGKHSINDKNLMERIETQIRQLTE